MRSSHFAPRIANNNRQDRRHDKKGYHPTENVKNKNKKRKNNNQIYFDLSQRKIYPSPHVIMAYLLKICQILVGCGTTGEITRGWRGLRGKTKGGSDARPRRNSVRGINLDIYFCV